VPLTLFSADLALNQILWRVLDDAGGSDHLPILTSLQSFNVPSNILTPIFDLTRHIAWSTYTESVLESLEDSRTMVGSAGRYNLFVDIIRGSAIAATTRSPRRILTSSTINTVWWDGECDRLNDAKLVAFREFRRNGTSHNYENYLVSERILRSDKIESWRRYCSTLS
jgi:hypothetical protein